MFLKKTILPTLIALTFFASHKTRANGSDRVLGYITKRQIKNFSAGLGIGLTHGGINRLVEKEYNNRIPQEDPSSLYYIIAYMVASGTQYAYDGNWNRTATLWGRAMGQFLAESVKVDDGRVKISPRLNLSLFWALLGIV